MMETINLRNIPSSSQRFEEEEPEALLDVAEVDLDRIIRSLKDAVRTHGIESKGMKASITVTVKVTVQDPVNEAFVVEGKCEPKFPGRKPAKLLTLAGRDGLVRNVDGKPDDDPRQLRFANANGEMVGE